MTLVVSDISSHGIVMVGDSAVTIEENGIQKTESGAVKVQYSRAANIGFAIWGNALVDKKRLDKWLAEYIKNHVHTGDSVLEVAQRLADHLNPILSKSRISWATLRRGIHMAGYREGYPVLFHVHCGPENGPYHELRVHKDFPDDQRWTNEEFEQYLRNAFIHLRNGYYKIFAPLFDQMLRFASQLRQGLGIDFPPDNLIGRLNFYKILVKFVADVLQVSEIHQGVNDIISFIAFNAEGIVVKEQPPIQKKKLPDSSNTFIYF